MNHQTTITIVVDLDKDKIPQKISWGTSDMSSDLPMEKSKAFLLSIFSEESRDTLRLDLWTSDMQLQEMDRLMYYTLKGLADTYAKSTNNLELAEQMQQFADYFGTQTEIKNPK